MSTNKQIKGKPITTSVPTFAIRFHASGEELEDIYPSDDDKSTTEDKNTETVSETTKQESSPMRDYLNKFGKRSSSIDAGINDTSQNTSNDPWRIFSNFTEFKGKLTKTVEEKLSEIKSKSNDNENSPKFSDKYKANSKDNSSISDSEEPSYSECSVPKSTLSSTAEDLEMSSDDESVENDRTPTAPYKLPLTPDLRNRNKSNLLISYKKDQDEIQLTTLPIETVDDKLEDDIESGIEAIEEASRLDYGINIVKIDIAPKGFIDLRPKVKIVKKNFKLNHLQLIICIFLIVLLYFYPVFTIGLLFGVFVSTIFFGFYYFYRINKDRTDNEVSSSTKNKQVVPILEIPAVKEYQAITKFEGWMNEYPEVYNPYTYHIPMTQSVFLKLENNILRISHTTSKIPKRGMWNETKPNVTFTHHRVYNLKGAEIVLLPKGLIHKRLWSKKYPICVILNKEFMHMDLPSKKIDKEENELEDLNKIGDVNRTRKNSDMSDQGNASKDDEDDKTEVDEFKEILERDCDDDRSITEDWDTLNMDENSQETRIYLFGRTGREKEDWYRRLVIAARNPVPEVKSPDPKEESTKDESDNSISSDVNEASTKSVNENMSETNENILPYDPKDEEEEYLEFMSRFSPVKQDNIYPTLTKHRKKGHSFFKRKKDKHIMEDEVDSELKEKDKEKEDKIDNMEEHQWLNVFIGRIIYDINKNPLIIANMQERIQKKLSTIKLPYFIEEIVISHLNLGTVSPRFNKIHPPYLDERGLWIDMDMTYDGLVKMSLVTKLNLMKLKEQAGRSETPDRSTSPNLEDNRSAMFYSDIEDSAESSSDDEYLVAPNTDIQDGTPRDAKGKKFLRMIDNIASSSLFQQATENKFIKRAMEGVSKTELKLTVDLRYLDGTLTTNISAPPSDRIWIGFRGNPKLTLSAKPAFGERSINFTQVTKWIEKKLSQEFQKFLVLPNMEDFVCPLMNPNLPK